MNMIRNLDDIKNIKLSLKIEISLKEDTIKSLFSEVKNNIESFDFKNDIVKNIVNNPAILINTARITYDLIMKWKARKQLKNKE
ncbi:MAG: hypothetical protein KAV44_02240 [Bacteroidales bacterium]|nr:hypothetical protein [Bacteroidales bacterium]